MTHPDLVERARKWLATRCPVVATEVVTSEGETPDAIGWNDAYLSTILIECKASRADFLRDRSKRFRMHPEQGMGAYRYFLAPAGMIKAEELPEGWGLIEAHEKATRERRAAGMCLERNVKGETRVLVSLLRRIGSLAPAGVSIKCFTIPSLCTATLSVEPEAQTGTVEAVGEGIQLGTFLPDKVEASGEQCHL